jgi:hypothetical protein
MRFAAKSGAPVVELVVLTEDSRRLLDELDEQARDAAFMLAQRCAFAGLAARQFFSPFGYTNSDAFRLVVQSFDEPGEGVVVRSRRRDGHVTGFYTPGTHAVRRPPHVPLGDAPLDEALLRSLCTPAGSDDALVDAIVQFNAANTDAPTQMPQAELIFTVGALQCLASYHGGNGSELATRVAQLFAPSLPLAPDQAARLQALPASRSRPRSPTMRETWARDLYALRGTLAHGRLATQMPSIWSIDEHLLLASHLVPLLVKLRLAAADAYSMTEIDREWLDAFEHLAGVDGLLRRGEDHPWWEVIDQVRSERQIREGAEALRRHFDEVEQNNNEE